MASVRTVWLLCLCLLVAPTAYGAEAGDLQQPTGMEQPPEPAELATDEASEDDLLDMDLDQLSTASVQVSVSTEMSTEVTSVSRTEQPISRTASAVFVITNEMIRRSGARNIPEALRMAPGVHVARIGSDSWAISIRGFNAQYAKRLLVQIDGRAVYTPIYSGTYWEQQFVPLKDVDRIEVVRGPGGAVWGSNSVNGIINVVTKSAHDTQGGYLMAGGGSEHRSFSHVRAGGGSRRLSYRVYGQQVEDDRGAGISAVPQDGLRLAQCGFRLDYAANCQEKLTLQGDLLSGTAGFGLPTFSMDACNLLGRWTRQVDCETDWSVQAYFDHFSRLYVEQATPAGVDIEQQTYDIDATLHHRWNAQHDVVCGIGYREYAIEMEPFGGYSVLSLEEERLGVFSCFLQDTWTLAEDHAFLTLGCKLEENSFVGFVYQPAAKLAITPDERTSVWASVARAVRTPSVIDRSLTVTQPGPPAVQLNGNPAIQSEDTMTYELGLRRQPNDWLYWDLAVFYSKHEHVTGFQAVSFAPAIVAVATNGFRGESWGGELWGTIKMTSHWRLRGYYALLNDQLALPVGTISSQGQNTSPRNMAAIASSHDLGCTARFDATLRYADQAIANDGRLAPAYLVADMRLGFQPREHLRVSLVGQNLLPGSHLEFQGEGEPATEVQSGVYGMVEWGY